MNPLDDRMTMTKHLEELRRGFLRSLVVVLLATIVMFRYSGDVFRWLVQPVGHLVFFAPAEAFLLRLKIAFFGAVLVAVPFILFEVWRFVVRGLTPREKNRILWILPVAILLFAGGVFLAYGIVVPVAIRFLMSYGSDELRPLMGAGPYFEFLLFMCLSFGFLFQIPLVLLFLRWTGLVTPRQLSSYRRHIYLGTFIMAALLTPGPDVFSQLMLATPTLLLFEMSMFAMRWIGGDRQGTV